MAQQLSGQDTIATAGTAETGPDIEGVVFRIKALHGNTNMLYVGNDGNDDVTSTTGIVLDAGEHIDLHVGNLKDVYFDVDTNGEGYSWIMLKGR